MFKNFPSLQTWIVIFSVFCLALILGQSTVLEEMQDVCGRNSFENRFAKRIIGGTASRRGEWPWLVSIYLKKRERPTPSTLRKRASFQMTKDEFEEIIKQNPDLEREINEIYKMFARSSGVVEDLSEHLCGGTLISDQWILSAQHCFRKDIHDNLSSDPDDYLVILGEHEIRFPDVHEDIRKVSRIVLNFTASALDRDIALLKLEKPIEFNKYIQPACLPDKESEIVSGEICYVAGWGHEVTHGKIQEVPNHVAIPILDYHDCIKKIWLPTYLSESTFVDTMFCAGSEGKDSCQFDSGGPLMCMNHETNRYQVSGIVSFGYACGNKYPGIYTNVASYKDWINEVIESDRKGL